MFKLHNHSTYGHQTWQDGDFILSRMTLSSRVLTRARDKLKPLYLHYHSVYGYQTWQDGNIH